MVYRRFTMGKNQYEAHKLFYRGLSLLENPKKISSAIYYIKKSHKLGSPLALFEIAIILRRKDLKDYPQDLEKSDKLLKQAKPVLEANVDSGLDGDLATHFLAQYYLYGYAGVEIDEAYAISLEEKVAKRGLVEATEFLIAYFSNPSHNNVEKVDYYTQLLRSQKAILASGQKNGVIEMLADSEESNDKTVEESIEKYSSESKEDDKSKSITSSSEKKEKINPKKVKLNSIACTEDPIEEVEPVNEEKVDLSTIKTNTDETIEDSEKEDGVEVSTLLLDEKEEETTENEVEEIAKEVDTSEVITEESTESEKVVETIEEEKEIVPHYVEESKPLPKKGKEPTFDYKKFIPVFETQSVEAKIIDKKEEESVEVDLFELTGEEKESIDVTLFDPKVFAPRERIVYTVPVYSEEELSSEHIAYQQILKALDRLEDNDENSLKDAIQLLGDASKVYPAKCNCLLGEIYSDGKYTDENELLAIHYYKQAETSGSAYASFRLGQIYLNQDSPSYDKDLGIKFIRKSASTGYAPALDRMGKIYHNGEISLVSYQAAYSFYKLAVERNYRESYNSMAKIDEARGNDELAQKHRELSQQ